MEIRRLAIDRGWIVVIPIVLVLCFIWIWPGVTIEPVTVSGPNGVIQERTQTLYLLSSIAQAFAAILALVFTASLIALQLFAGYSHRLHFRFFDGFTIGYIALYIAVVLLSIFLIAAPDANAVKILLSIASICLILLVPYIMNLKYKFRSDSLMNDLKDKAIHDFKANMEVEPEAVSIIENVISRSCQTRDYDTVVEGLRTLVETFFEMQLEDQAKKTDILDFVSDRTAERIMRILEKNVNDSVISEAIIRNLRRLGLRGVRAKSYGIIGTSTAYLSRIAGLAVKNKEQNLGGFSLSFYSEIIVEWAKGKFEGMPESQKWEDEIEWLLEGVRDVGKESVAAKLGFINYHVLSCCSDLAEAGIDFGFERMGISAIKLMREVAPSIVKQESKDGEVACYWLAKVGAKAAINNETGVKNEVVLSIKAIEDVIGKGKTKKGLAIPQKYPKKDEKLMSAYNDFVKEYLNEDSE